MEITAIHKGNKFYLAGPAAQILLQNGDDVSDLIGLCLSYDNHRLLLYAENFPPKFFDLASGKASTILQKFRNHHIRVAAVLSEEVTPHTRQFGERMSEESRGNMFRVFTEATQAEAWLIGE